MSEQPSNSVTPTVRFQPTEHTCPLPDGTALFYRAWLPSTPTQQALLLFHRGHEHSARWQDTVEALALDDMAIFAWDARGHGRSPGTRGAADSLAVLVQTKNAAAQRSDVDYGLTADN